MAARPFEGLRIVDLSMFMSGPLVTLIAADLGAEVIKVESVQRLDGWRGPGPGEGTPSWEGAPQFNWINRNKRGITLNLADPRGADLLKRLVAISDAVIENYTPRVMRNFGLDYESLRKVRPDLVMLSMPGFGGDGPWRDFTAFAWTTEQMGGINTITGYEGGPPLFTNTTGGDPLAGLMGAVALFSALHHRKRTGEGQFIDLSQMEAATMFTIDAVMETSLAGHERGRHGNRHPGMAPHNTYLCAGGQWVAIACRDDDDWERLTALIGRADLASDDLRTLPGRQARLADIDAAISEWVAEQDADIVARTCQAAGVPAAAVLNGPQLLEDPHLAARQFFLSITRRWLGTKRYPGQPFRMSRVAPVEHRPTPTLGAHTDEVLSELLGLGAEELAALAREDITGTEPLAAR